MVRIVGSFSIWQNVLQHFQYKRKRLVTLKSLVYSNNLKSSPLVNYTSVFKLRRRAEVPPACSSTGTLAGRVRTRTLTCAIPADRQPPPLLADNLQALDLDE